MRRSANQHTQRAHNGRLNTCGTPSILIFYRRPKPKTYSDPSFAPTPRLNAAAAYRSSALWSIHAISPAIAFRRVGCRVDTYDISDVVICLARCSPTGRAHKLHLSLRTRVSSRRGYTDDTTAEDETYARSKKKNTCAASIETFFKAV